MMKEYEVMVLSIQFSANSSEQRENNILRGKGKEINI